MLPILTAASDGAVYAWRDLRDNCVTVFEATGDELAERLPSGGSRFDSRIQWALTHLVQAGLLTRPRRGHVQITARGKDVLDETPDRIDIKLLDRFEEHREFRARTKDATSEQRSAVVDESKADDRTPLEAIDAAVRASNEPSRRKSCSASSTSHPSS